MSIWSDVVKDYKPRSVPKRLALHLKSGDKSGIYLHNGFFVEFNVIEEDASAWVVDSPLVGRDGGEAGGTWCVSKKNPNKGVFD